MDDKFMAARNKSRDSLCKKIQEDCTFSGNVRDSAPSRGKEVLKLDKVHASHYQNGNGNNLSKIKCVDVLPGTSIPKLYSKSLKKIEIRVANAIGNKNTNESVYNNKVKVTRDDAASNCSVRPNKMSGIEGTGLVDFEDMIPSIKTSKLVQAEKTSTSACNKPQVLCKIPKMKIPTFAPPRPKSKELTPELSTNIVDLTMSEDAPQILKSGKKKRKRKKRRFRNMDCSSDEDSVGTTGASVNESPRSVLSTCGTMITGSASKIESNAMHNSKPNASSIPVNAKPKEKVHILEEYIFPLPKSLPRTPVKKQSPSLESESLDLQLNWSDDSVSSIQSKMSIITGANPNSSQDLTESDELNESLDLNENQNPNDNLTDVVNVGERFWVCDDDDEMVCLERSEDGGFILVPTEIIEEGSSQLPYSEYPREYYNNNSPQIESKEMVHGAQQYDEDLPEDYADCKEHDSKENTELQEFPGENENENLEEPYYGELEEDQEQGKLAENMTHLTPADPKLEEMSIENDLLSEPVANVGNEEIISQSPEEECQIPCPPLEDASSEEPIYIINDPEPGEVRQLAAVTPLEYAFVQALNGLREADTPMSVALSPVLKTKRRKSRQSDGSLESPEAAVTFTPIKTDLETLMKVQDQCSIEEYQYSDSDFDYDFEEKTRESLAIIDKLSREEIVRIVLGEGLEARLVNDQEQSMDLLQLPPDYSPKPILLKPLVPVTISTLIPDSPRSKVDQVRSPMKSKCKTPRSVPIVKKRMQRQTRAAKVNHKLFKHVTGDSDLLSPPQAINKSIDAKVVNIDDLKSPTKKFMVSSPVCPKSKMSPSKIKKVSPTKTLKVSRLKKVTQNKIASPVESKKADEFPSSVLLTSLVPTSLPKRRGRPRVIGEISPSKLQVATSTPYKVVDPVQFSPLEQQLRKEHNLSEVTVQLDSKDIDMLSLEYDSITEICVNLQNRAEDSSHLKGNAESSLNLKGNCTNLLNPQTNAEIPLNLHNCAENSLQSRSVNSSFSADAVTNKGTSLKDTESRRSKSMPGRKAKRMRKTRIRWSFSVERNDDALQTSVVNTETDPVGGKAIPKEEENQDGSEHKKDDILTDDNKPSADKTVALPTRKLLRSNKLKVTESLNMIKTNDLIANKLASMEEPSLSKKEAYDSQKDLKKGEQDKIGEDSKELSPKKNLKSVGNEYEATASMNESHTPEASSMLLNESSTAEHDKAKSKTRSKGLERIVDYSHEGPEQQPIDEVDKRKTRSSSSRRSEVMGLCSKYLVLRHISSSDNSDLQTQNHTQSDDKQYIEDLKKQNVEDLQNQNVEDLQKLKVGQLQQQNNEDDLEKLESSEDSFVSDKNASTEKGPDMEIYSDNAGLKMPGNNNSEAEENLPKNTSDTQSDIPTKHLPKKINISSVNLSHKEISISIGGASNALIEDNLQGEKTKKDVIKTPDQKSEDKLTKKVSSKKKKREKSVPLFSASENLGNKGNAAENNVDEIKLENDEETTDVDNIKSENKKDTDVASIKSNNKEDTDIATKNADSQESNIDVTSNAATVTTKNKSNENNKKNEPRPEILKINLKTLMAQKANKKGEKSRKLEKKDKSISSKNLHKKKMKAADPEALNHSRGQSDISSLIDNPIKLEDDPDDKPQMNESETSPKVPKLILKLSPHHSPSIIKSPEKMKSPNSSLSPKHKLRKRKILSPLVIKSPTNENSTKDNDIPVKGKTKKQRISDVIYLDNDMDSLVLREDTEQSVSINKENSTASASSLVPEIKEEDLENVEVKSEPADDDDVIDKTYHIGELILARLGTYCYWPSMVIQDNALGFQHVRYQGKQIAYHVRFFGDNGRRAWIIKSWTSPYKGKNSVDIKRKELLNRLEHCPKSERCGINRAIQACTVSPRIYRTWKIGMEEAESLINKTVDQRHEFFDKMFAAQNEKRKRKRRRTESNPSAVIPDAVEPTVAPNIPAPDDPEVKQEENVEEQADDEEDNNEPPMKKYKLDNKVSYVPSVQKSNKANILKTPPTLEADGSRRRSGRVNSGKQAVAAAGADKIINNKDINNVSLEQAKRNYVLEDLELINKGSFIQGSAVAENEKAEQVGDVVEEVVEKNATKLRTDSLRLSDSKKINSFKNPKILHADIASEISDTDSSTKISIPSSGSKRVLFKDVPRLPVCQICLKNDGIVLKCKGTCSLFYHPTCFQTKEEPVDEVQPPCNVEIVDVKTKTNYFDKEQVNLNDSDAFNHLDLIDQLDNKLKKVMAPLATTTLYHGSTTDDTGDSEDGAVEKPVEDIKDHKGKKLIEDNFICYNCIHNIEPPCHACGSMVYLDKHVDRFRCSVNGCGRYFHKECLKCWPQAVIKSTQHDSQRFRFTCPMHNCQTCISDNPKAYATMLPIVKTARCLKCPATYHINSFCIPAGTQLLSHTQIICPRHVDHKGKRYIINANWCFICSRGGDLLCCETCPTSVHEACISINFRADDTFVCEDCESGRLPLYDDIVWAKFSNYKWWPGVVLLPEDIPDNVRNVQHRLGEFVVKFYGTHDHHWFALGRVFHFDEDDRSEAALPNRRDIKFQLAINEARSAIILQKELRKQREILSRKSEKPPKFTKIKMNRYIGHLKPYDGNVSSTNPCTCDKDAPNPCGPDSDCLNRLLLTECDPEVCLAKGKCQNQMFDTRIYPPLVPIKTATRGWGLTCTEPLVKGQFIIEYVGEVVDQEEYHRRIDLMNEQKTENYYFLTLDKNRIIDAGPRGNLSRFINHCCNPNCETQKWTIRGETRVGIFAKQNISATTELTFNYNMETIGEVKKICHCGADNCSGFLGTKQRDLRKPKKLQKKVAMSETTQIKKNETKSCFICDKMNTNVDCTMRGCGKSFHITCLEIPGQPKGKFTCPRHFCNICTKRTNQCCNYCLEAYCTMHRHNFIKFNRKLGSYLCNRHNSDDIQPTKSVHMNTQRRLESHSDE